MTRGERSSDAPGPAVAEGDGLFHLQLRRFPHSANAFNVSEARLHDVLLAWAAGRTVEVGERHWEPAQSTITILRGPQLSPDQLAMGRGWAAARRRSEDVTARMLARSSEEAAQTPAGTRAAVAGDELASQLLALYAARALPLRDAWRMAGERRPDWYAGERLIAAEHAVRTLLAAGLVQLELASADAADAAEGAEGAEGATGAGEQLVGAAAVDAILRDSATWSGDAARVVIVRATPAGLRAAAGPA